MKRLINNGQDGGAGVLLALTDEAFIVIQSPADGEREAEGGKDDKADAEGDLPQGFFIIR